MSHHHCNDSSLTTGIHTQVLATYVSTKEINSLFMCVLSYEALLCGHIES